ncbi:MAG TPA: hypothetical protein VEW71_10215 [Allosphingosinicella sp.]|nr:hypothetical protein [Allosphingosinicella sp.]
MPRRAAYFRNIALAGLTLLAACGGSADNNLAAIDNELVANGADPALTSALEDQLMVDNNLNQQAHPNSVRPPETPMQAQYPADAGSGQSGARVRRTAASGGGGGAAPPSASECGAPFDHGPQWAGRMPREFPAYPGGRVTEAAGNDNGDCRMRVVTFTTSDPHSRVLEHYRSLAARAGYTAEHQVRGGDQVLGGTRDESAFYLIVTPARAGSQVALIVNNGR